LAAGADVLFLYGIPAGILPALLLHIQGSGQKRESPTHKGYIFQSGAK
jgi:hypothetical protein